MTNFLCPTCNTPSKVLETRSRESGNVIRRTRVCPAKHKFTTLEFLAADIVRISVNISELRNHFQKSLV